ncbi:hypothetical protein [Brevibacillus massiliensis]|jgi:hypothetical protein|uniref:hypothetical protein n=1 Tax=Brevibacillus massiliensis TaxID=1118054 RepID=UPI00030DC0B9|nr:hypothetical protein [Brevibacillus massiliensis]
MGLVDVHHYFLYILNNKSLKRFQELLMAAEKESGKVLRPGQFPLFSNLQHYLAIR